MPVSSNSLPRPVATDLDGTIVRSGGTISSRTVSALVHFRSVRFAGDTRFDGAQVGGDADFSGAQLHTTERLGPIVVAQPLSLARARFGQAVQVQAAASTVKRQHATFAQHATLLVRYAEIILDDLIWGSAADRRRS
jgi:hypothetical protein